ncbi:MAG: dihydropteroate synthase [Thermogutta sp.]|nr:dihydropteroate synthase [Thermogutta sp.]HOP78631.1 dihydropteroate synthase [Thermogutta sp.]HPU06775.1 dihydropteroate synthase [Thermogutta sp.]HQF13640.1 dihydropteroate synthase [Thermogutta sp.]
MVDRWTIRNGTLDLTRRPLLMGILNVTPDSFSDGGRYFDHQAAIEHGEQLAAEGADILDIGGESTRPGAEPVPLEEELRRVIPVVEALAPRLSIPISIDTSKAMVARQAIIAGAAIVNDVTALRGDPDMVDVVRETGAGVCLMHMKGTPRTMQQEAVYEDVVSEVASFLLSRCRELESAGIPSDRLAIDPGLGFAKTPHQNWQIIQGLQQLRSLGYPLVIGHSRKRFIREVVGNDFRSVLWGTVGVGLLLAAGGVDILRVHDVKAMREALALWRR